MFKVSKLLERAVLLNIVCFIFVSAAQAFSEDDLSRLEYSKYGVNYADESLGERLNRLETDYFGMAQTGGIDSRIAALTKINSNIKNGVNQALFNKFNNFSGADSSIYNPKPKGILRGIWDNIASGFDVFGGGSGFDSGFLTGYTPPISNWNTLTSSGSSNSFYGSKPEYYPYSGAYDRRNRFFRRHNRHIMHNPNSPFWNNNIHSSALPHNNAFNYSAPFYNNGYAPYTERTHFYIPPDIQTKSSIHILKD